ncbi:MAG: hypothetical protein FWC70_08520 [Defluviitaleaceae bacterium]|nr:hypothetical protein [Defluviitaleaceae bacterium]
MQTYFLGVDGGNTKTEYLLCSTEGKIVDVFRAGTCSHERFDDGFDGMERVMREQLDELFARNEGVGLDNIVAAGFGLAGADMKYQVEELTRRVKAIGFSNFGIGNDGLLGIKAASENGVGICAVNGTGTVVVGVDECGETLQIGGISASGDSAGGHFIFEKIIVAMYEFTFRCGPDSAMFPLVRKLLGITDENMLETIAEYDFLRRNMTDIVKIGAKAAVDGDEVAKSIFDDAGSSVGKSVAGCIRRLAFKGMGTPELPINVVQVGSVWHKVPYRGMSEVFLKTAVELSGRHCRIIELKTPAAAGGVLWAKELADGIPPSPEYRKIFWKQM